MKRTGLLVTGMLLITSFCFSQNVGVGTSAPHSSSALDIRSADKGILVPRIALTAANAAAPVSGPADALLVYNTATSGTGTDAVAPGFYYWSASLSRWIAMRTTDANNTGPGSWGDCSVKNISGYNSVTAADGVNNDLFGRAVSISGNWAIIGAPGDDNGFNADQGSAYLFFFDGVSWIQQQKITAADGAASDFFGFSVSISGNYAVVGAYIDNVGPNPDQGSVYVFFYNGTSWVQSQQLFHPSGSFGDQFGYSVCVKNNSMIIGASNDGVGANGAQGSAHVFVFNGSSWVYQAQLTATDGTVADHFGKSVSIDNLRAIVGAPDDDLSFTDQGSAYIFFYNGTAWTQQQKFTHSTFAAASDNYGTSVSVSGNNCLVGCPGFLTDNGAVDIWSFGIIWSNIQTIQPPGATGGQKYVGRAVAIDGDYFIIGAPGIDVNGIQSAGKLFIYKNYSGLWRLHEDFSDPAAGDVDALGSELALHNGRFVCGASLAPDQQQRGVAIFGKIE